MCELNLTQTSNAMTALIATSICLVIFTSSAVGISAECETLKLWDGTWFINEFAHDYPTVVNSSENSIVRHSTEAAHRLGDCTWSQDDLFIFRDTEKNCSKCIMLTQKHKNVLYSREGFECTQDHELNEILPENTLCESMKEHLHDDSLTQSYFWFKIDYKPTPCPFGEHTFEFSYKNMDRPTCEHPISHASSCLDHTNLLLHYEACVDQESSKKQRLTCVGDWVDNFRYLVADVMPQNVHNGHTPSLQSRFRCFTIAKKTKPNPIPAKPEIVTGFEVGTADIATCAGFLGPDSTETVLHMVIENAQDSEWQPCSFPKWLSDHRWMDIESTVELVLPLQLKNTTIHAMPRKRQIKLSHQEHRNVLFPETHSHLKCLHKRNISNGDSEVAILVEQTIDCEITQICVRLIRRSEFIFQVYYLPQRERKLEKESCFNASAAEFISEATMISTRGTVRRCPIQGDYHVNNAASLNESLLGILSDTETIDSFESQWSIGCTEDAKTNDQLLNSFHLNCLDDWTANKIHYSVVTPAFTDSANLMCLAYDTEEAHGHSENMRINVTVEDCLKLDPYASHYKGYIDSDAATDHEDDIVRGSVIELVREGGCYASWKPPPVENDVDESVKNSRDRDFSEHSADSQLSDVSRNGAAIVRTLIGAGLITPILCIMGTLLVQL